MALLYRIPPLEDSYISYFSLMSRYLLDVVVLFSPFEFCFAADKSIIKGVLHIGGEYDVFRLFFAIYRHICIAVKSLSENNSSYERFCSFNEFNPQNIDFYSLCFC